MKTRSTNISSLSKKRLREFQHKKCILCRGRGVVSETKTCKKCLYYGLRTENLTNFRFK